MCRFVFLMCCCFFIPKLHQAHQAEQAQTQSQSISLYISPYNVEKAVQSYGINATIREMSNMC